jgi:hypothetical protein
MVCKISCDMYKLTQTSKLIKKKKLRNSLVFNKSMNFRILIVINKDFVLIF